MRIPLSQIAHGRSGDKGDTSNIGVIAFDERLMTPTRLATPPGCVAVTMPHPRRRREDSLSSERSAAVAAPHSLAVGQVE